MPTHMYRNKDNSVGIIHSGRVGEKTRSARRGGGRNSDFIARTGLRDAEGPVAISEGASWIRNASACAATAAGCAACGSVPASSKARAGTSSGFPGNRWTLKGRTPCWLSNAPLRTSAAWNSWTGKPECPGQHNDEFGLRHLQPLGLRTWVFLDSLPAHVVVSPLPARSGGIFGNYSCRTEAPTDIRRKKGELLTRIHDMGGRFGHGPIKSSPLQNPVFEQPWHARALAMTLAAGALGRWNLDASRHSRERLPPHDYARFSYYEKWLAALVELLVRQNVVARDELADPGTIAPLALDESALRGPEVADALAKVVPTTREADLKPCFPVGCKVRTRRPSGNKIVSGGHTRLPLYAAGCIGKIEKCHGNHVFPDSNAHFLGEAPEPLYSVSFESSELWGGEKNNSRDEIIIDLWESYLVSA